jgi:predicted transcriptional regulator of viral defense system
MSTPDNARLLALAKRRGVITAGEAARAGIHSQHLTRLVAEGVLERITRGHYRLAGRPITEHHGLAVAARAVPHGVICLLSALAFHGIGTQLPAEVWIAIERRARDPALQDPPLRVVRYSGAAFTVGIETHRVEGQPLRVYGVAKTLADLFKHRNKVGLDVAIEALREAWRERKFKMEALDRAARACRVARVMRPYVEAVVA